MIGMTGWAMKINLVTFYTDGKWLLFGIGLIITILQLWMIIESIVVLANLKKK